MSPTSCPAPPCLYVKDLETARRFHVHVLGCLPVRHTEQTLELELHGQPLTLIAGQATTTSTATFILGVDDWCTTSERLRAHGIEPVIEPGRRFSVTPGEQCAMRLSDPDGNTIELRGFAAEAGLLAA